MCPSPTNTLTWTRIEKYIEIRDFVPINFSYIWITSVCIFRKCKIMYKSCSFVNFAPINKFCFGNYSAPIEVSPIGMSDHLTVLLQQELHCISNFRSS